MKFYKFALGIIVSSVLALASSEAKAQDYLLDYGPGSISWTMQQQQIINQMQNQTMMMRMQLMQYYQNQAYMAQQQLMSNPTQPMQGIITQDGTYLDPNNVNNYTKERVQCDQCGGSGRIYKSVYMGNGHVARTSHPCGYCDGGYVYRYVSNE